MKKIFYYLFVILFIFYVAPCLSKLNLFTIASHRKKGFIYLQKSCKFHNIPLKILGLGKPYKGNWSKIRYIYHYIRTMPDDEICMFVDGYDVLILANESEILEKFYTSNRPFIIGAEKNCWPKCFARKKFYPESPTEFRYINSGCLIGYAWAIKEVFKKLSNLMASGKEFCSRRSDQILHHNLFLRQPHLYTLDYNCNLFLNFYLVAQNDLDIYKDEIKIHYKPTDTWPIAFHGNGNKEYIQLLWNVFFPSNR